MNAGLVTATRERGRARGRAGARDRARHAAPHRALAAERRPREHGVDGRDARRDPDRRDHRPAGRRGARRRHRRTGTRGPEPDQLHARERGRGRPRRHRHPRRLRLRPGGHAGILRDHAAALRRRRPQHPGPAALPPGHQRAHRRDARPREPHGAAAHAGQHELCTRSATASSSMPCRPSRPCSTCSARPRARTIRRPTPSSTGAPSRWCAPARPTQAIPMLEALRDRRPDVTLYHTALGQAELAAGRVDASRATLERAMRLFPRNVPVTVRYAETLLRAGDAKQAHVVLLDLFNNVPPTAGAGTLHGDCRECRRRRRRLVLLHVRVPRDQRRPHARDQPAARWRRPCPASTPCSASDSTRASASCRNTCRKAGARAKSREPQGPGPDDRRQRLELPPDTLARDLQMFALTRAVAGAVLALLCSPAARRPTWARPGDPLERMNRATHRFNDSHRPRSAAAGRGRLPQARAAARSDRGEQLPGEPRLPDHDRQRPAAAQDQGHADRPRPLRGQLDARDRRHVRSRRRTSASRETTRTSARRSAAGACRPDPTSWCRSSGPRR